MCLFSLFFPYFSLFVSSLFTLFILSPSLSLKLVNSILFAPLVIGEQRTERGERWVRSDRRERE
jgi:hypothetical protein